jgi:hypothetical protein
VWVFTFYITSAAVIAYAYMRITRGLEKTYITRFQCVQDTFWFVAHYFAYGCVVGLLFFITVYVLPRNSDAVLKAMENVCVYVIACRGYFDSLIWFLSHNSSLQPLQIKTTNQTDLKGAGIFTRISFIFSRNGIDTDDSSDENSRLNREQLLSGDSSTTTTMDARSGDGKSTTERYTDYDLSPQLNFALRSELLLLVSMGIKESVMRLGRDYASHTVDEEGKGSGTFQAERELAADHASSLINGIPVLPCDE